MDTANVRRRRTRYAESGEPTGVSRRLQGTRSCLTPGDVLSLATDIVGVDLLPDWTPGREVLALCAEWYLRDVGRKALNIPHDEQPSTAEELHDWLEQDWPPGHIPAEIHALFKADG